MANIPFLNNAYFAAKVGIGTTNPGYKLSVDDNSVTNIPKTLLQFDAAGITDNGGYNIDFRTSSNDAADRYVARIRGTRESAGALSQLSFWTESGTALEQRMTIRASGNVGIGTTSPGNKLHIFKNASLGSPTSPTVANAGLQIQDSDNSMYFDGNSIVSVGAGNLEIGAATTSMLLITNGAEKMRITSTGNVGIGTTSPEAKLTIKGDALTTDQPVRITNSATDTHTGLFLNNTGGTVAEKYGMQFGGYNQYSIGGIFGVLDSTSGNTSGDITFDLGNGTASGALVERMRITHEGNVGIGTASPSARLEVFSTTANKFVRFRADNNEQRFEFYVGASGNASRMSMHNDAATETIRFAAAGNSYFNGGNVGIGTTSPDSKLDIEDSNPFVTIQGNSSSYVNAGVQFISNQASTTRGLGNFYYSTHSDVEWFSGLPYGGNDAFVINRNASYTVPSSQSSPPGIGASAGTLLKVDSAGAIQFNNYSGTNKTGTPTYLLGTDASGNIVKTNTIPGSAAGPYLPLAGGTMTGNLNINTSTNFPLLITGTNATYTAMGIRNTGTGDAGIYMDGINGDFGGSDYAFIGQKDEGYLLYNIGTSSPLPYHVFTGGNVGIGTDSPDRKLEVDFTDSVYGAKFTRSDATGSSLIEFANSAGVKSIIGYDAGVDGYKIGTASATNFVVKQTGNVGIGTTSPGARLDVGGDLQISSNKTNATNKTNRIKAQHYTNAEEPVTFMFLNSFSTTNAMFIGGGSTIENAVTSIGFYTGGDNTTTQGSLAMIIDNSQNVGIGTTSPGEKLEVDGIVKVVHTDGYYANYRGQGVFFNRTENYLAPLADNTSTLNIGYNGAKWGNVEINAAFVKFENGPNEFMRIDSSGNVGIGTSSPSEKLEVAGNIKVNANGFFGPGGTVTTDGIVSIDGGSGTGGEAYLRLMRGGTSGFILNHTATAIQVRATANIPMFFYTNDTIGIKLNANSTVSFPEYAAGYLKTDASGNITADNSGGGLPGGPYLPLAGGTMTGNVIFPGEEANSFKIAFTGASASSGISTVDQSGAGLYIGANSRVNNSGVVVFNDTSLPSSGIYFDGWDGDDMEFYTGSSGNPTKRLTIEAGGDAIFTGNVGIGTTSPSYKLDVRGASAVSMIRTPDTTAPTLGLFVNDGSNGVGTISVDNGGHMTFDTGSTGAGQAEKMRIDSSGRLLINATSTAFSDKLYINSDAYATGGWRVGTAATYVGKLINDGGKLTLMSDGSRDVQIGNNGNPSMLYIDTSTANVGIGTTSPTARLHVVGTGLFTGLVSGITPVDAANFVTKAYVDGSGGGTGPFLPLAGGTMTGTNGITMPDDFPLKLGVNGSNDSQIFWDGNNLEIQARAASSDIVFRAANSSAQLLEFLTIDGGVEKTRAYKDIHFQDNIKATFGDTTSPDLQIYHDSSDNNSYIKELGTGDLIITGGNDILFNDPNGFVYMNMNQSNSVELYYANSKKFETTNTGVAVTGEIIANGNITSQTTGGAGLNLRRDDTSISGTNTLGSISFQGDDPVDGTFNTGAAIFGKSDGSWGSSAYPGQLLLQTRNTSGSLTTALTLAKDQSATFAAQAFSSATSSGDASSTLTTKGYVDGLITGATIYRGTWDPDVSLNSGYGNPNLNTVTQTSGYYYICSADGAATPNGTTCEPDSWNTGDWVIWNDDIVDCAGTGTGGWQKIDNSSVLSGAGTGQTVALWQGASSVTDSETLGNAPITVSGSNTTFAGNIYASSNSSTIGTPRIIMQSDGTLDWGQAYDYGTLTWNTGYALMYGQSGKGIKFATNGSTTALTLDTSQNATFAGDVSLADNKKLTFGASPDFEIYHNSTTNVNHISSLLSRQLYISADTTTFSGDVNITQTTDVGVLNTTNLDNGSAVGLSLTYPTSNVAAGDGLAIAIGIAGRGRSYIANSNLTNNLDASNLAFYTESGGVIGERMIINQDGNVGIGTDSPSKKLEVVSNTTYDGIQISGLSIPTLGIIDTTNNAKFVAYVRDSDATIGTETNHPLTINTNNTERIRIDSSGNVGIGTTSPQQKLDVIGRVRASYNTSNYYEIGASSAGGFVVGKNGGVETVNIRTYGDSHFNGGNFGIGTTTPQSKLQVAGGIQMADDTATASADKVGTMRYRTGTEYVDVDGVELVTNGEFTSNTGWNLNSNWSISGGTCNADGTSNNDINQNQVVGVVGQSYRIIYVISAYTQGSISARIGNGVTDLNTGTGTFSQVVTATTTDRIRMNIDNSFIGSVDSLSIVKVTAEDASYADMCMQTGASTYEWVNIVRNTY